ncbi:sensor histidine kinase [Sphingomonas sp. PB4P5]|uniref:sensor histidine kinase n=1 Tax=Parasphingomonas puruogangriensis TaxID=3096155 RepID=UPI002FC6AE59
MGSDRFTRAMMLQFAGLLAAMLAFVWAVQTPGLWAVRWLTGALLAAAIYGVWQRIARTNVEVARFVEALHRGDVTTHFHRHEGSGFGTMGDAFNAAIAQVREERRASGDDLRYLEALIDDMPVALLTIDATGRVDPGNKAARRLFAQVGGARPEDYAIYGATFAARLADAGPGREEMLILNLDGHAKRALVRSASLTRLGHATRAVIVQPVQETLNAVEMATQTDLVRVLTHEILNSLTPVTSLAATAAALLGDLDRGTDPQLSDARDAVTTLARRAEGLGRFIDSYRAVASPPRLQRRVFAAAPFVAEIQRLFAAEWPGVTLDVALEPALELDADPDLIAQLLINLLRNAAQACGSVAQPIIILAMQRLPGRAIALEVSDSGPGVPHALRDDIFLPFFTTRATGTGVGLNLARQIVTAHGGNIEVVDGPSGGALFRIVI